MSFFIETARTDPRYFFAVIITVIVSVCIHELMHGVVAVWLGDETPIEQDRITLNPMVHMGPTSLITLLLAGIAWGAMPIDPTRLRGKYGGAIVAAVGPLTNAILAILSLAALGLWFRYDHTPTKDLSQAAANGRFLLQVFGTVNVLLALFNLLPLPPLDGSKVLGNFSHAYDNLMDRMVHSSPMVYLQISLILFLVAGWALMPVAQKWSLQITSVAAGMPLTVR